MEFTIKICGLKTQDALETAIDAGADWVGLVFFPKSPRHVGLEQAAELSHFVGTRAKKVALLVDPDDPTLEAVIMAMNPDLIQLHGKETPERVADIKNRFGRPIIKAIGVSEAEDIVAARSYTGADWILLDAKPPKGADLPGGNGISFDWQLLAGLDLGRPLMLSGGLDPSNVAEAIATARPKGVDVSSGVESAPGVKDPERIRAFISAARETIEQGLRKDRPQ
jgi:phosphoribosylanthranilate isomerase